MKFYIKIIRNKTAYTEDDIQKFLAWIRRNTPLEPEVDFADTDLPLKWKPFGVGGGIYKNLWGLDEIKEQLRQTKLIPQNGYHVVIFLYDATNFGAITPDHALGHWTYPNDLNGAAFMEVAATTYWETIDDQYRVLTHEFCHCAHRLAWWNKLNTPDSMDVYDKEFEPDAPDGNRARNLKELSPYWDKIAKEPKGITTLKLIIQNLQLRLKILLAKVGVNPSRISAWAEAIKSYEGWSPGSRSYRNNNAGNLKFIGQEGATHADNAGFAVFSLYEFGWKALVRQLTIAANGTSKVYKPTDTLVDFFKKYAPSRDNNDPVAYAMFVANRLKVAHTIQIKELL